MCRAIKEAKRNTHIFESKQAGLVSLCHESSTWNSQKIQKYNQKPSNIMFL